MPHPLCSLVRKIAPVSFSFVLSGFIGGLPILIYHYPGHRLDIGENWQKLYHVVLACGGQRIRKNVIQTAQKCSIDWIAIWRSYLGFRDAILGFQRGSLDEAKRDSRSDKVKAVVLISARASFSLPCGVGILKIFLSQAISAIFS
jgi:hypothetical protein